MSIEKGEHYDNLVNIRHIFVRNRGWKEKGDQEDKIHRRVADLLGHENAQKIEDRIRRAEKPVVVDIGCGKCKALSELADKYPTMIPIGIDLHPESADKRIHLIRAEGERLPLTPNSVDVLYSVKTYCYVYDKLQFLVDAYGALKPGGAAFIEIGDRDGFTNPPLGEIVKARNLQQNFTIEEIGGKEHPEYVLRIDKGDEPLPPVRASLTYARHPASLNWDAETVITNYRLEE